MTVDNRPTNRDNQPAPVDQRRPATIVNRPRPAEGRPRNTDGRPATVSRPEPVRDRGVDGLRAYAIAGVVFGHWLVTAMVLAPDGSLHTASPLSRMPGLVPATWLLQTLGLFFFASGYASARSLRSAAERGLGSGDWLRRRLGRLGRPVTVLLGGWLAVLAGAAVLGVPTPTLRTAATLVFSPLWFLLPLVVLIALTGPLSRALRRYGAVRLIVPAMALVALSDLAGRNLSETTGWRVPVAVLVGWLVPYLLGMAIADGRFGDRRTGWWLLLGGVAAMAGLVRYGGYPASAVGVPGDGVSNLDPPSLFAVCLALAQVGAALLVRPMLADRLRRLGWWRPVHRLNSVATSVYLWHQSTLLGVTALAALAARLAGGTVVPGLHSTPDGPGWLVARLAWLPLLALVLVALVGCPGRRGTVGEKGSS